MPVRALANSLAALLLLVTEAQAAATGWPFANFRRQENLAVHPVRAVDEAKLYQRCHSHLFNAPPTDGDVLLKRVRGGSLSGADACDTIVDSLQFDGNGRLKPSGFFKLELLQLALDNFEKLHHSWFAAYDFTYTMPNWGSLEIYDTGQPALFVTRSLFAGRPYKEIVRGKELPYAIRESRTKSDTLLYQRFPHTPVAFKDIELVYQDEEDKPKTPMGPIDWVERGKLVGISGHAKSFTVRHVYKDMKPERHDIQQEIFESAGGGILGSPAYLLLNMGQEIGEKLDGEQRVYRRWAKNIDKDLLCRDLPVVLPQDSLGSVNPKARQVFRRDNSCYICHHSMDHTAGLIRHLGTGINNNSGVSFDFDTKAVKPGRGTLQFTFLRDLRKNPYPGGNGAYTDAGPAADFHFRDWYGVLHEGKIRSVEELGETLARLPDFYVCAASRYLHFLTGVRVETDPLKNRDQNLDPESRYYMNLVASLGAGLEKSQSLRALLKEIIRTPVYRDADFSPKVSKR